MSAEKAKQFGELVITFTDKFDFRWDDSGSGASKDGAYWHPLPPSGFKALGSVGVNHYGGINGTVAALCVKEASIKEGAPALRSPVKFDMIWKDSGSGAHKDGSCWRPVAPDGYVALGDVFVKGYNSPSLEDITCVRADLAYGAVVGNGIWADHGSGASADFGSFEINVPAEYYDTEKGLISVGSFVGNNNYNPPVGASVLHCLNLLLPTESAENPPYPTLTSYDPPASTTTPSLDRTVYVPFTAVKDDFKDLAWKVSNSPFYKVDRYISYKTELYDYNQTSVIQHVDETISTGVSTTQSSSFSTKTGVSVTAEGGVSFLGTGGKVSATVSVELGWTRSTGITEFTEKSITRSISVPPNKAQAVWAISYSLVVKRDDNSTVSNALSFEVDYFIHSEFPDGKTTVETPSLLKVI
ncbi:Vps62-related protein [Pseudoalteromonas ostreae]|uniref:Vps62-related protein n=1 Tax=Pseudoalteromonas ostreae TaxID=2774154 RepID=UPI001B393F76|nr:Vps62-related protein [Pseudoalteromonas ostreae]